jgi:hypothetical protein
VSANTGARDKQRKRVWRMRVEEEEYTFVMLAGSKGPRGFYGGEGEKMGPLVRDRIFLDGRP